MSSIERAAPHHPEEPAPAAGGARLDLASIRQKLAGLKGRHYWRGLEELAGTGEFVEFLHREFPANASEWTDLVSRRDFLQLMAASLALAGLSGCTRNPVEKIIPYVKAPEIMVPGRPVYYATACLNRGVATGVLVENHMGRPTKIEGNDLHPASLGRTDAITQASILSLYDPGRSQVILNLGDVQTWGNFVTAIRQALAAQKGSGGSGVRLLTGTITSPTLADQIQNLLRDHPRAKWYQYEPLAFDNAREGSRLAFGSYVDPVYKLDQADVILSLDADFMTGRPDSVRLIRDFTARRRVGMGEAPGAAGRVTTPPTQPPQSSGTAPPGARSSESAPGRPPGHEPTGPMNRLYVVESTVSVTGSRADHRLPVPASLVGGIATRLLDQVRGAPADAGGPFGPWIAAVGRDLLAHTGRSVIIPGDGQPPEVHALAHQLNAALGNVGTTVTYQAPVEARPTVQRQEIAALAQEMSAGGVQLLIIAGGNPAYDAPPELNFASLMDRVGLRVHLGLYENETSDLCHWHVPETHYLEAWSDARAFDGTVTIMQPLIAPLYDGHSLHELLAALSETQQGKSGYDLVHEFWSRGRTAADAERFWSQSLNDGIVAGTAAAPAGFAPTAAPAPGPGSPGRQPAGLEVVIRPHPFIQDGRNVGNAWLQELPEPMTRLTWDNAVWVSPALAEEQKLDNGDVVEITAAANRQSAPPATAAGPVWIVPGLPRESVTVHLGYGRTRAGRVGTGVGFNAYPLLPAEGGWFRTGAILRKTGKRIDLACTQTQQAMEGRHLIRTATLAENAAHPEWVRELEEVPAESFTMYQNYKYEGYAWGMTIDLTACVGCGACTLACQAENNIPVVGKKQVMKRRAMHWIRVDRYFEGDLDTPGIHHQPVPCMHCENAPCEVVCPVGATVHDGEGLNEMVYNRCVGTRYCSNNCPYKVRRFNFFQFSDQKTPSLALLNNPDVTVRTRGVMEKCTFCIQRINAARIPAERELRRIGDGEVIPACAQACPAEAIVFGDINDPGSRVARLKAGPLNYGILASLNTRPRTTYLAELKNPNPEVAALEGRPAQAAHGATGQGEAGQPGREGR